MKPSELTVDVVREELASIIAKYPDRRGSLPAEYDDYDDREDFKCVYYTDEYGVAITSEDYYNEDKDLEEIHFVTPICIVGQWIEDFHPEFKHDSAIRKLLYRNGTLRSNAYDVPFPAEVCNLLTYAQDIQDGGTPWSNIEL